MAERENSETSREQQARIRAYAERIGELLEGRGDESGKEGKKRDRHGVGDGV